MRRTDQGELQPAFKAWLTAAEIHAQQLLRGAASENAVERHFAEMRADSPRFLCRPRPVTSQADHARSRSIGGVEIHYSRLPLEAIVAYEARHRPMLEAANGTTDRRYARLGKSVLAQAQGGQLRAFILQRLIADPRLPVVGIRDRCIERFGLEVVVIPQGVPVLVPMPPLRTFHDFVQMLRARGFTDVAA